MSGHTCRTSVQAVCQHLRPQSKRGLRTSLTRHAFCNIHHWHLPTSSKTRAAAKLSAAAGCEEDSSRHSRCHRLSIAKHRQQTEQSVPRISMHVAAVIAAVISLSDPAWAELQTVPSSQATQYAKPIQQQKVDKKFVALLFAGGAASLFGSAVLLEKNSRLFPAIYKANQVMREADKRNQGRVIAEQAVLDLEQEDDMRLQRSVEAGLADAQARVLPDSSNSNATASSSTVDVEATASRSEDDSTSAGSSTVERAVANTRRSHDDADDEGGSGSSAERAKGSQLSAADKQQSAVNSIS